MVIFSVFEILKFVKFTLCKLTLVSFLFRVLHGFISSGLTETQYVGACKAAHIGNVDETYITTSIKSSVMSFFSDNNSVVIFYLVYNTKFPQYSLVVFIENLVIEFIYFHCLFPCHAGYHLCSILFSCEHTSVIFFSFPVYTSLGYKNAVKAWYEIKLQEARVEAQQDTKYLLQGDVCFNCMKQSFREFLHVSFLFANY